MIIKGHGIKVGTRICKNANGEIATDTLGIGYIVVTVAMIVVVAEAEAEAEDIMTRMRDMVSSW